ncbi:DEAD/DEAH box helicase [Corynebacterium sp. AOP12-C2-36]|uniref:DEAD/DEAH box helicase n=1 Tax=Corynebacterium sp. AOP12-C2-36 TaxID=3457723 RepID=UPI00403402F1
MPTSPATDDPPTDAAPGNLSPPRQLRGYQVEAVAAVEAEWDDGIQRTSVIAPTGSGKSTIMSKLAVDARERGNRVVILAHRRELLDAISETVDELDPGGETPGIVMGTDFDPGTAIVCASFQTLSRSRRKREALGERDLILVDECHHILARTYLQVLANFGLDVDPDMSAARMRALTADDVVRTGTRQGGPLACGFTATMTRGDGGKLGAVWETIAFERDLKWAIDNGFLVPPTGLTVVTEELNILSRIKSVGGDFKQSELDEVMRASIPTTVDSVIRHAADRVPIIFAVSVEQGEELAAELTARGYPTRAVSGNHKRSERQEIYSQFRSGEIRAMVTVQVLTEGADFPRCDCVILARPTRSDVLFSQIVGRGVRLYTDPDSGEEKSDALVMDLTGMLRDKKLATLTQLYDEAEVTVVDTEGEVISEPGDTGAGMPFDPSPEREGPIDLEEVDLFLTDMPSVVVTTSPGGLTFLPGHHEKRGECFFLWPPAAEHAEVVTVWHVTSRGLLEVLRTADGVPVRCTFAEALVGAGTIAEATEVAVKKRASWRRRGAAPSAAQMDMARSLGLLVTPAMNKAKVSDMISGAKLDAAVQSRLRWLTQQVAA